MPSATPATQTVLIPVTWSYSCPVIGREQWSRGLVSAGIGGEIWSRDLYDKILFLHPQHISRNISLILLVSLGTSFCSMYGGILR